MTGGKRRGPSAPVVLASCLALTLAGCELFQPAAPQATVLPAVVALPPPPPRKPAPPGATLARLPPASEAPAAGEPAPGGFDRLIGLDQAQVAGVLGDPGTRVDAPPATIWRYGGAECEADVYFYLDLQSQTMRALHYEVRNHDLPERSAQRCYDALAGRRRDHAESNAGADRAR